MKTVLTAWAVVALVVGAVLLFSWWEVERGRENFKAAGVNSREVLAFIGLEHRTVTVTQAPPLRWNDQPWLRPSVVVHNGQGEKRFPLVGSTVPVTGEVWVVRPAMTERGAEVGLYFEYQKK